MTNSSYSYFKPTIESMTAYVPGAQGDVSKVLKLNTNENAYPPSPRVAAALGALAAEGLRVYPDSMGGAFREAVSCALDVPVDWILPGNGSDNLIVMLARACGGPIVAPGPTFPYYQTQADVEGVAYVSVPYADDSFTLPVDALIAAGGAVTFIANPNSPTGSLATRDELASLASGLVGKGIVVLDEAYVDFTAAARQGESIALAREFENVVVLRTLSKGYSLAGLRLGFAVANPALILGMSKAKEIYNVGVLTQAIGAVAMADSAWKTAQAERIIASREVISQQLTALGWRVWPSEANFVLARPEAGGTKKVADALKARGILVRYFDMRATLGSRVPDGLRITVGTAAQNARLIETITTIQAEMEPA